MKDKEIDALEFCAEINREVSEAVLAERERCAKIAEALDDTFCHEGCSIKIAAAIRSGK